MLSTYPNLDSPNNTFSRQEETTIEEYGNTFVSLLSNILPSQTFSAVPSPSQTFSAVSSPPQTFSTVSSETFSAMPSQTFSTMPSQTFSANGINVVITPLSEGNPLILLPVSFLNAFIHKARWICQRGFQR